ncbi:MAG: AGE family epimerase/isomerase [Reinekea sp.]|jgi:mannose/cellobiose epimerase-like protein (N-acyl-D-glucosamine 2-epimerase family)
MNFNSLEFLTDHCKSILKFYEPIVIDPEGGFFQNFYDNGAVFDPDFRQLVSSTRIIFNYATAGRFFNRSDYLDRARHGLVYMEHAHWQEKNQSYAWLLRQHRPVDMTQQAYGYAFVLLAYAACRKAGIVDSNESLLKTYDLLEQRFWLKDKGVYADEISAEGVLSDYRGQNSNMHLCEAMIAAFEASGEQQFITRAQQLAESIAFQQADKTGGLVWEHFTPDFEIDWDYNRDDPKNLYRPWGFQPGHQAEWAKLLLSLNRHVPDSRYVDRARSLFDQAWTIAWDDQYGGLIYGFNPEKQWCDEEKYFWVQAESFAAAAMLAEVTGEDHYWQQYEQLWQYCWDHFVDHEYGAWFRVLSRDNQKTSNEKSSAGAKCDYHTLGACFEVLRVKGVTSAD